MHEIKPKEEKELEKEEEEEEDVVTLKAIEGNLATSPPCVSICDFWDFCEGGLGGGVH